MIYSNLIILGTGQLAIRCANLLQESFSTTNLYDTNERPSSYLRELSARKRIPYFHLGEDALFQHVANLKEKTLLISATNPYIIPDEILEKKKIFAINCHHALLPKHPGRNAVTWTIFEMDEEAGITWHEITHQIDAGNIIIQKSLKVEDHYTSLLLLKKLDQLAFEALQSKINEILSDDLKCIPQNINSHEKIHYSWEKPNDGILDTEWDGEKISAFLRSMDYGILDILGKPKINCAGKIYQWKKYGIYQIEDETTEDSIQFDDGKILIRKGNYLITLNNYYEVF